MVGLLKPNELMVSAAAYDILTQDERLSFMEKMVAAYSVPSFIPHPKPPSAKKPKNRDKIKAARKQRHNK